MKIKIIHILLPLVFVLVLAAPSLAGMGSTNYSINRSVISSGGGPMGSANHQTNSTAGQSSPIGSSLSSNFMIYAGFWFSGQAMTDSDMDGIPDNIEYISCTNPDDADTDDDGIVDGDEDINHNGIVDTGETDPCDADTDNDGIQDGTELGVTTGHADTGGTFIPDADGGATVTDPLNPDSDGDGVKDGMEDKNHNGRVDLGESDPNDDTSIPEDDFPWELFYPAFIKKK